ncbi:MAG TPA: hypothetical protein VJM33_10985 [Microthrixaceae bacterium]|nr:hypothetical protein [Microthrixaceae bacterium]
MRRAVVAASVSLGVLVMASCVPPPTPTPPLSGLQQFCFPGDQYPLDHFDITPVDVPPGASMSVRIAWVLSDDSDSGEFVHPVTPLVAWETVSVDTEMPDVGLCARISASPGLTYQVVVHRVTDPTTYTAWTIDLLSPGVDVGFLPL